VHDHTLCQTESGHRLDYDPWQDHPHNNRQGLPSSLNYLTPVEYEQTMIHHQKAAQVA